MWRRVVYVVIGIVSVNVALMAVMFVQARDADTCDVSERGLVVWDDEDVRGRDNWIQVSAPFKPTDLPPCRGRLTTDTDLEITSS